MSKKKFSFLKKLILSILVITLAGAGVGAYFAYNSIYKSNVNLAGKKSQIIHIPTGSTFEDVKRILYERNIIIRTASFEWLAERKGYTNNIKPGRYRILSRMGNNELISLLRSGKQEPVRFTFNNVRTKQQLASRVCGKIEADSMNLMNLLNNEDFLFQKFGMRKETIMTMFIPNTYEFYWNTSPEGFLGRMAEEYKKFWTEERKEKARKLGLSQSEVSILASIVQSEQLMHPEERPRIAGLYLNRLRIGMALQADPTVIFAIGDFSIKRLKDRSIVSPYNTYKHPGLPPGPICLPDAESIDAVLNAEKNNYIYMCAKDDLSNFHDFTNSYDEHQKNAAKYQKALDGMGIR